MHSPEAHIKKMAKIVLDKGVYDDDPDLPTLWHALKNLEETRNFTEKEFNAFFEYCIHLLSLADSEEKKKMKERAIRFFHSRFDAEKCTSILRLIVNWMDIYPDEAMEVLSRTLLNVVVLSKALKWLQDQANSTKILFRFILGKLRGHYQLAEEILKEIVELLLDHAFDSRSGAVLPIRFIQHYILDLMLEAGLSHEFPSSPLYSSEMNPPPNFTEAPLLVHINLQLSGQLPNITRAKALSIAKIDSNFRPVINQMENMQNLRLMELRDVEDKAIDSDDSRSLAKAVSTTNLESFVLDSIQDATLCTHLLGNLSPSLLRLTLLHSNLSGTYQLPPVVNLQSLHMDYIHDESGILSSTKFSHLKRITGWKWKRRDVPGVSGIFSSTTFPQLKRITITGLKWKRQDIRSLVVAVREGRLPVLKHLCIRFANLSKRGREILEISQTCELQTLDLMDTNLTEKDGRILLMQLEEGNLPSIQSLNLLYNSGLNSLVTRFQFVDTYQQIDIQCAEITKKDTLSKVGLLHKVPTSIPHSSQASQSPSVVSEVGFDVGNIPHSTSSNLGATDPSQRPTTLSILKTKPALPGTLSSHCNDEIHTADSFPADDDSVSTMLQNIYSVQQVHSTEQDSTIHLESSSKHHEVKQAGTSENTGRTIDLQFSNVTTDLLTSQVHNKVKQVDTIKNQPECANVTTGSQSEIVSSDRDELQRQWFRIPSLRNISQGIILFS